MSFKKLEVNIIRWKDLSDAIKDELSDSGSSPKKGFLFWVKVPSTAREIEAAPNWLDYCRTQDIQPGTKVLVEA